MGHHLVVQVQEKPPARDAALDLVCIAAPVGAKQRLRSKGLLALRKRVYCQCILQITDT